MLVDHQGHPLVCLCPLGLEQPSLSFLLLCVFAMSRLTSLYLSLILFLSQAIQLYNFSEPSLCLPAHRKLCLLYGLTCANVLTPSWLILRRQDLNGEHQEGLRLLVLSPQCCCRGQSAFCPRSAYGKTLWEGRALELCPRQGSG